MSGASQIASIVYRLRSLSENQGGIIMKCPVAVALLLKEKNLIKSMREQNKYRKQQKEIKKLKLESIAADDLPPCVLCHPDVFYHCQQNGIECKQFEKYSSNGKDPFLIKGRKKHRCVGRMETILRVYPDLAQYCRLTKRQAIVDAIIEGERL